MTTPPPPERTIQVSNGLLALVNTHTHTESLAVFLMTHIFLYLVIVNAVYSLLIGINDI